MNWLTWRWIGKFATFIAITIFLTVLAAFLKRMTGVSFEFSVGWIMCLICGAMTK